MFKKQYSDKDVKILIEMWQTGHNAVEIGDAIGKSKYSVRQFMHRNRQKYGFEKKQPGRPFIKDAFDKEWYGAVPFGHWTITKPWGKA